MKRSQATLLMKISVLSLLVAGALLALYVFWGVTLHGHSVFVRNTIYTPVCVYPDKSFCATEARFKQDMVSIDPSDMLAAEQPVSLTCPSASAQATCADIQPSVAVTLFHLTQNATPMLMMRNQFIALFRSYSVAHGPFRFKATTAMDGSVHMAFVGKDGASCTFIFTKINGVWQLEEPVLGM